MAGITIDGLEYPLALAIPPAAKDRIGSVEVEFVHDGKYKTSVSKTIQGFSGARVTERVQQGAPPHAIVVVRAKQPEADENTRVRRESRVLDAYGTEVTYTANGIPGLALGERNSVPLLGALPQGDAPKAVSEGLVATG